MNDRLLRVARAVLMGGLLVLAGCAGSEPVRYYVLSATLAGSGGVAARDIAVGVGPVELPEYLDRPQIVTRTSQNELNVADFDRWAGSLKDNTIWVLAENLAILLPSQRVSVYPWKRATPVDYQVTVQVTRFDRLENGESVLAARWRVLDGGGRELLSRTSTYRETPAGPDYAATVAAMSQNLEAFSRDLALRMGELSPGSGR
ncbi:MAG: PqiC family protein [Candidatus Competibacter sp.]